MDGTAPAPVLDAELVGQSAALRRRQARRRLADRLVLYALLLGAWEALVRLDWIGAFFVSSPSLIVADSIALYSSGTVYRAFLVTMYEALAGLAIGTVLGIGTGFLAALSARVAEALEPLIVALNSMPRVAIAPMFIIWFGFGAASKIALAALVVYFTIFFNTFAGMRAVEPVLLNSVRVMGASKTRALWMVSLPSTMAWVFAGMKTSISMALVGAVVGEFVGATSGLGYLMVQASGTLDTTRLFSLLILLSIVGTALFSLLRRTEDHVLRWRAHHAD